jgi:hypothetical protein
MVPEALLGEAASLGSSACDEKWWRALPLLLLVSLLAAGVVGNHAAAGCIAVAAAMVACEEMLGAV